MTYIAFSSPLALAARGGRHAWQSRTTSRRDFRVCRISMSKKTPKRAKPDKGEQQSQDSNESTGPPPPLPQPVSAEEMLRKDLEVIRAKRKKNPPPEKKTAPLDAIKNAIDTILLWDFFLVVGLLVWLAVALVPHFAAKNDVLLDPWLGLWQPFIQPVLGFLMLGTIVQGTISFINTKD